MPAFNRPDIPGYARLPFALLRWALIIVPVALSIGSLVALFLWLLNRATQFRFAHPALLYALPLAGLLIHMIYRSVGRSSEKGNNLILEQIGRTQGRLPLLMAPVIFITTIITHLFGGSAGREGTAVQIGGSIASAFARLFRLDAADNRTLLIAGMAAGFGAVFGTPLTGAVFAIEVLAIGRLQYDAFLPALMASLIADLTVSAWHVQHTHYFIDVLPGIRPGFYLSTLVHTDLLLLAKIILASVGFGLAAWFFAFSVRNVKHLAGLLFSRTWMIPAAGGILIILITLIIGKPDYLGLGVEAEYPGAVTIPSAFSPGGAQAWSWLWKMAYTAITLGTGFKGGEVTPLFYIGTTLGHALSGLLDAPLSLFAALGFIAVFAGATNTPFACTLMGAELFGGQYILYFAIACFTAYFFSGHRGIYAAQELGIRKYPAAGIPVRGMLPTWLRRPNFARKKPGTSGGNPHREEKPGGLS